MPTRITKDNIEDARCRLARALGTDVKIVHAEANMHQLQIRSYDGSYQSIRTTHTKREMFDCLHYLSTGAEQMWLLFQVSYREASAHRRCAILADLAGSS